LIIYGSHVAAAYMFDGQPDKALEQIEVTVNLDPGHTASVYYLGVIYIANGMYDKAIALAEKGLGKDPDDQNMLEVAGYAYARAGQRQKAEEIIARFREIAKTQYVMTSSIAPIYIALGEKDKAITELEKAYELRDPFILQLNIHPYFEDIRDDPRVIAIAKRIGLPDRK
jgi:tetratricopeptide (TPR) repeat protein